MRKKLLICSLAGVMSLGLLVGVSMVAGGGANNLATAAITHDSGHTSYKEHAFDWADPTKEGYRPYWMCNTCCVPNDSDARYDYTDTASYKTKHITVDKVILDKVGAATIDDVADGDEIKYVNDKKLKYVDQGPNKATGGNKVNDVETSGTPRFVKDTKDGKEITAAYFSASGKTGDSVRPTSNAGCSEFRFSFDSRNVTSVSFSYRYENWGTATWGGQITESEPSNDWKALFQFQRTTGTTNYYGVDITDTLNGDGAWHDITITYNGDYYGSKMDHCTSFIFKFADLRGYMMISNLKAETAPDDVVIDDGTASNLIVGRSETIGLTSGSNVTWSSSDETVATVDENGKVTALKTGSATITATDGLTSDNAVINVTAPSATLSEVIEGNDSIGGIYDSYTASVTHTYDVPVVHKGLSMDDAINYAADSKISAVYSGKTLSFDVPAMAATSANGFDVATRNTRYVKFTTDSEGGVYKIFSNTNRSCDASYLDGVYKVTDGVVSSAKLDNSSGDDFDKSSDGVNYCLDKWDSYAELTLEADTTYVIAIKILGSDAGLSYLGVVKVTTADGVTTAKAATSAADLQVTNDDYSLTFIKGVGHYSTSADCGAIAADDGMMHEYSSVAGEYVYDNSDTGSEEISTFNGSFDLKAIFKDTSFVYDSTDVENKRDCYAGDYDDLSWPQTTSLLHALGVDSFTSKIVAYYYYETNTVSLALVFDDNATVKNVTIAEATSLPVSVSGVDVMDGGEAGSDAGVSQDW
jgi:hypothetical protein